MASYPPWNRRCSLLQILFCLLGSSHGFVSSERCKMRTQTLVTRESSEDDTTSASSSPFESSRLVGKGRCPDFPSFATSTTKQKRVMRVSRDRIFTEDLPFKQSQAPDNTVKVLNNIPMEPSLFLSLSKEALRTRLMAKRTYANREVFEEKNLERPPSLSDLEFPPPPKSETFWISIPSRLLSFGLPFLVFPYIMALLNKLVNVSQPDQLIQLASDFAPGVSILYGTFVSLTLSLLYTRMQNLQDNIALETSLLMLITRNLLHLFRTDKDFAVAAGQCVADQVRTLISGSRGNELTALMYSDPYARMLELVELREYRIMNERDGELGGHGVLLGACRNVLKDLMTARSKRISDEALSLPPTHFFVLTTLTMLTLLGYCVSVLPAMANQTGPSLESSVLFGILCSVYVLFYNFANDLNDPCRGVYQIRRSGVASHLLEIKWLLVNHPLLRGEVDFEPVQDQGGIVRGDVMIRSPGLEEMWFQREDSEGTTNS